MVFLACFAIFPVLQFCSSLSRNPHPTIDTNRLKTQISVQSHAIVVFSSRIGNAQKWIIILSSVCFVMFLELEGKNHDFIEKLKLPFDGK